MIPKQQISSSTSMCQSNRNNRALQMGFVVFTLSLVTIVTITVLAQKKSEDETCRGNFKCLPAAECGNLESLDFHYQCGVDTKNMMAKICCLPKSSPPIHINPLSLNERVNTNLFPKDECGLSAVSDKIANGKNATLGQFPWMALLGYTTKKVKFPQYFCGGTLINDRYILTAAHCTSVKTMKLTVVRLGELNLESEKDCEIDSSNSEYCADPPLDLPVEKLITHENYNNVTLKHDIALIRLATNVSQYTEFVRPVCLPFNFRVDDNLLRNKSLEISGWGKQFTSSVRVSTVLQFTTVKGWDSKTCTRALPKKVRPINDTQICATGDNFQEACKGDSGGPLTYRLVENGDIKYNQIGIVSFKSLDTCGSEELPTVFTKVDAYLDWILKNVEP